MRYKMGYSRELLPQPAFIRWCVYKYDGKLYRIHESTIHEMSRILHEFPKELREDILFWCKMVDNPD